MRKKGDNSMLSDEKKQLYHGIKKNVILFCLVGVLILATNLFAAEFTIRLANPVAPDHSWGRASEVFKKSLEDLRKGRIAVEVHHAELATRLPRKA